MDSTELQEHLVGRATANLKSLRIPPSLPDREWQLGITSLKGNVRRENQDVGIGLTVGDFDILIVCDGCGGIPWGREASLFAASSAGMQLVSILGTRSRWKSQEMQGVIHGAIWAAQHRLAMGADDLNIAPDDLNGGLRTTLIVLIGRKDELHYGYIGDGGGWVVRTTGDVESFLSPQKSPDVLNVLQGSLGPSLAGTPVIGTLARREGDLALVGSDGVFDRIPPAQMDEFGKEIVRLSIQQRGNLQKVVALVCEEYAACKDNAGYIFDDNLTLGLLGTRSKPILSAGFWKSAADSNSPQHK